MSQPVVVVQQPQSNSLGTAGFVFALLGFFTCGFLSPIGFLLSAIGLLKAPRGLALTGFLLSGGWALLMFFGGAAFLMGLAGIGAALPPSDRPTVQQIEPEVEQPGVEPEAAPNELQEPLAAEPQPVEPEPLAEPEFRLFQDATGKFQVRAKYAGYDGRNVELIREDDGRTIRVPIDKLSGPDGEWVRSRD